MHNSGGAPTSQGGNNSMVCSSPEYKYSGVMHAADWLMVTSTVVVTFLVVGLVVLCTLGRLTRRHSGYSIATRVFFQACFTLFLPFMSYVFSGTKSKPGTSNRRRAELVILWMLLVELLRKKVSAGMAPTAEAFTRGIGRYSLLYPVEEVVRMAWIGYLIYAYVHGFGIKSFFIILWIFGVATLCKRAVCIHLAKDSFDLVRNASLISGYMKQLVQARRQLLNYENEDDDHHHNVLGDIMSICNYVVMGESRLEREVVPHGFELQGQQVKDILTGDGHHEEASKYELVRVCDIWRLSQTDAIFKYNIGRNRKLLDVCIALALFKLLRRRMEGYHMAEANTPQARRFVLQGLLVLEGPEVYESAGAQRVFDVVELELRFLDEYYQDIIPLALPRPMLFVGNFALSIVFVMFYGITVLLVTSNANIIIAVGSLFKGIIGLFIGMLVHHKCFLHQAASFVVTVHTTFDIIITYLLMLTLLAVQTYQLVHYVFSDWFLVSLMCNYARKPSMMRFRHIVKSILWAKHRSRPIIKVHQLNILKLHPLYLRLWVSMLISSLLNKRIVGLPDAIVTGEAKMAIVKALKDVLALPSCSSNAGGHFSNGMHTLRRHRFLVSVAGNSSSNTMCDNDSVTMILMWHIATTLFEMGDRQPLTDDNGSKAAIMLSRYCMYLVAYEPGLLPYDEAWTKKAYQDTSVELKSSLQSCSTAKKRRERLMSLYPVGEEEEEEEKSTLAKGVKLAKQLEDMANNNGLYGDQRVWMMLLYLWAELLVCVARRPVAGPEAHMHALSNGGEFITHIWAILIHAGIHVPEHPQEDQASWCQCHPV